MTRLKHIKKGPSQWEVMLSLFENKPVEFTFSDGSRVSMTIYSVYNFRAGDVLVRPLDYVGHPTGNGWLFYGIELSGDCEPADWEAFIEYDMKTRDGSCKILTEDESLAKSVDTNWLPDFWRQMMDLPQT